MGTSGVNFGFLLRSNGGLFVLHRRDPSWKKLPCIPGGLVDLLVNADNGIIISYIISCSPPNSSLRALRTSWWSSPRLVVGACEERRHLVALAARRSTMSYDNYFVGPPVEVVKLAAAPTANHGPQVTAGEQNNPVSTTQAPGAHNYFVGTPVIPEGKKLPSPAPAVASTPPQPPRKKNGSLARCFPCLFGGGADER